MLDTRRSRCKRSWTACIRYLDLQIQLPHAQGAEVWHWSCKVTQLQHRLHQACGLPQSQTKQVLERQSNKIESLKPRASSFTRVCRLQRQTTQYPDGEGISGLESCVVLLPVSRVVTGLAGLTHILSLLLAAASIMQQSPTMFIF